MPIALLEFLLSDTQTKYYTLSCLVSYVLYIIHITSSFKSKVFKTPAVITKLELAIPQAGQRITNHFTSQP